MEKQDGISLDLNKDYFKSNEDLEFLNDFLSLNTNLKVKIISREDFNNLKGNIKQGDLLGLPDDLKNYELPSVILKLVGENKEVYSSQNELQNYLKITISYLISQKGEDKVLNKEYKKSIKKYTQLFIELFGEEETKTFSSPDYFKNIEAKLVSEKVNKYKLYISKIKQSELLEGGFDLENIEKNLAKVFDGQFVESIYEIGRENIGDNLETFTRSDLEEKKKKFSEKGLDFINGDFSSGYLNQIAGAELGDYSENKELLRENLDIDYFSKKIEGAKDEEEKEDIRKEVALNILREVHKFPWLKLDGSSNSSSPQNIIDTKEMVCVGKAIISSQFLLELGIKHYALRIPKHSALSVILSGKEYYYDPTWNNDMYEINESELLKDGDYNKFTFLRNNGYGYKPNEIEVRFIRRNSDKGLLSGILWNRGLDLKDERNYSLAIKYFEKYIDLYPKDKVVYKILFSLHLKLLNKEEEDKRFEEEENNKYNYKSGW